VRTILNPEILKATEMNYKIRNLTKLVWFVIILYIIHLHKYNQLHVVIYLTAFAFCYRNCNCRAVFWCKL